MKIGIISDTHNNIELTKKAVKVFEENNIDLLVHAGDLTSPRMIELFKNFKCKFVLGNGDLDIEEMVEKCRRLGIGEISEFSVFDADGKKVIAFHGNNVNMFREAIVSGSFDYIIKGHTHHFENYKSNKTRVINPGALYGSEECSVAILDTKADKVKMIKVSGH
jgi:putative phosphoesterase